MRQYNIYRLFPVAIFLIFILATCSSQPESISPAGSPPILLPTDTSTDPSIQPQSGNADELEKIFIPGGTYLVGSDRLSDPHAMPDELPQRLVLLTGFTIFTHEVTNAMYNRCVAAGACLAVGSLPVGMELYASSPAYESHPVVGVDWNMADAYCRWSGGRLPTEAEWEVAARGDDGRIYPWGNGSATCANSGFRDCLGPEALPWMVGSFDDGNSPWGVWDMAGNVWEWVNDWYAPASFTSDIVNDPLGPWTGIYKVVRGGGFNASAENLRSALRLGLAPSDAFGDVGFRCVANSLVNSNAIATTDGAHSVHENGVGNLEEGSPDGGKLNWRIVNASCSPDTIETGNLLDIRLEITESPSQFYDFSVSVGEIINVYRTFPNQFDLITTYPDLPEGTPVEVRLQASLEDGTPIPWARATFSMPLPPDCGMNAAPIHTTSIACGVHDGRPALYVIGQVAPPALAFTKITVNSVDLADPLPGENTTIYGGMILDNSVLAGNRVNIHVSAQSVTNQQITYDWTDQLIVPTCSSTGSPQVVPAVTCNDLGGFTMDLQVKPANSPVMGFESLAGTRLACSTRGSNLYHCVNIALAGIIDDLHSIFLAARVPLGGFSEVDLLVTVPSCPEMPSSGDWDMQVTCDTRTLDGSVLVSVEYPPALSGIINQNPMYAWATIGETSEQLKIVGASNGSALRVVYAVPAAQSGSIRACIDTGLKGDPQDYQCQSFDNFEALRTDAKCSSSSEDWNLQITCNSLNPMEMVDLSLTYPGILAPTDCHLFRIRGSGVTGLGGNLDQASNSCLVPSLMQIWIASSDRLSLFLDFPDGSLLAHQFGNLGDAFPSCEGISSSDGWGLQSTYCTTDTSQVAAYITYPPALKMTSVRAAVGAVRFDCFDYEMGDPPHVICNGPVSAIPSTFELTYTTSAGGPATTISFPDWATRAPHSCPTPVPGRVTSTPLPPSCSSYATSGACTLGGCYWWPSDNTCRVDPEPPPPACSTYNGDGSACVSQGCFYWTNNTCNPNSDPCVVNLDADTCTTSGCSWSGDSCYSP
jgi:formylglycine-generating enzyme required for sulfatase activity